MNRFRTNIFFIIVVIGMISSGYALNYMYFTEIETTVLGERLSFGTGLNFVGPIRSNDLMSIMGTPEFGDYVITSANDFEHRPGFDPHFLGPEPVYNAPELVLPVRAQWIRDQAELQSLFFSNGDSMQARVKINQDRLRIWWSRRRVPFDSTTFTDHLLPDSAIVFFDCPEVRISGVVSTILILGGSGRIGLEDNIVYASSDHFRGEVTTNHSEKFALVAEGEIKILNTIANGRENSSGMGRSQEIQSLTSIALNGMFVALHESFTFENQNDPDSGYDFGSRDERGYLNLWGGIVEKRRGYVHRSNHGGTGYFLPYNYDEGLRFWNFGLFTEQNENVISPMSISFGEIPQDSDATDTVRILNDFVPLQLSNVHVLPPFAITQTFDSALWNPRIVIRFNTTIPGEFSDTLWATIDYYHETIGIPVHGICLPVSPADQHEQPIPMAMNLSAYPNPFNPSTMVRLNLPHEASGSLAVYDVLGRQSMTLWHGTLSSGAHSIFFDAGAMPAGIYFLRFESANYTATRKILLLK